MHHWNTILSVMFLFWKVRVSRMHTLIWKETGTFVDVEKKQGILFSCSQSERQIGRPCSIKLLRPLVLGVIRPVATTVYLSVALTRNTKSTCLSAWPHMLPQYRKSYVTTTVSTATTERVWRIRPKFVVGNQTSGTCIHKVYTLQAFYAKH
jgi:hypothetical protein